MRYMRVAQRRAQRETDDGDVRAPATPAALFQRQRAQRRAIDFQHGEVVHGVADLTRTGCGDHWPLRST